MALILLISTAAGCGPDDSGTSAPRATVLPVVAIKTHNQAWFSYTITFYGRIQSARRTHLAFEIPGQITELLIDEGDLIEAGKPIARLNTSILEAERKRLLANKSVEQTALRRLEKGEREEVVAAVRAMASKFDAELEQATRDRDRTKKLRDRNATSESEYDSALFKVKSLQASLDAAKARLLELETGTRQEDIEAQKNRLLELDAQISVLDARIDKAILSAPFTAHVIQRFVDEGAVVQQSQPILILSEAEQFEARFSVPITQLEESKSATTILVAGEKVPVHEARTISAVSPDTRTIDVVFTLTPKSRVIEGQTCTLKLTERVETSCVKLPVSALVPSVRGLWSAYRLEQDSESDTFWIIREEVTINHTDGDHVFVETSIPDDSLVVSEGVHKLVPGMMVRLKDSEP